MYNCLNIYGDISALSNWSNLKFITVHDTQISGSIDSFANKTNLTNLHVNQTQVSGSVNSLINLTKLQGLTVNITNLEYLTLVYNNSDHNKNLTGDISAFKNCTNLKNVQFNSTPNITGDVSVFSNCTKLVFVSLWGTSISGSFTNYNQLTNLTNIVFGYTNITGPLNGLANMPNVLRIDLASCQSLTGQVNSLANNTKLQMLYVNNT